jgi:biotin carboxyl carrier protein
MKKFSFKIRGNSYHTEILEFENNIATVEINGTIYTIEVEKELQTSKTPKLIRKEITPKKENKVQKSTSQIEIKAPLPGNILEIKVKKGDTISKGDPLLIMEAMKMENNILSEKAGIISDILISVGDSVLQNDILIKLN